MTEAQGVDRTGPSLSELVQANVDPLVNESLRRVFDEIPVYATADKEQIRARSAAGYRAIITDLETGEMRHYASLFEGLAYGRARQGFDVRDLNEVIDIAEQSMRSLVFTSTEDVEARLLAVEQGHKVCGSARRTLLSAFGRANQDMLAEADSLVEQMSAPILPISPGVIVLPLVGSINARRAVRITEALLAGIVAHRASLIILDITGVPRMDAVVADSLVRTARASQLLGAEVIVVGVSPKVAQTMAQLNMDLSGVTTLMHLQAGLQYAHSRSSRRT